MGSCIFCQIANREIPSQIVHEDDRCVAFQDINPKAPVHVLIVPKRHIESLSAVSAGDEALVGHLCAVAARIARDRGVAESGYRVVLNAGPDAGQSVDHLHLHLLAGRTLAWPPG